MSDNNSRRRYFLKGKKLENLLWQIRCECNLKNDNKNTSNDAEIVAETVKEETEVFEDFEKSLQLMFIPQKKVAIVGVGNELKGDDGAGPLFTEVLSKKLAQLPDEVRIKIYTRLFVVNSGTAPENITGALRRFSPEVIIFVDAAEIGMAPGSIGIFPPESLGNSPLSTHTLPLKIIIEYLKTELHAKYYIIGIQPHSTEPAAEISAEVTDAVYILSEAIIKLVSGQ
ncbi:MAG: hydrogenase 3 maturation endopeptidase HyCI [Thermoplasmata archaeon]